MSINKVFLSKDEREILKAESFSYRSVILNDRHLCDLELILNGGFSPLDGFFNRENYKSVINNMRLSDNSLWPIPITLDVNEDFGKTLNLGEHITLKDREGFPLAVMEINDIWSPNLGNEAFAVYGTKSQNHPAVNYLLNRSGIIYIGGRVRGISLPNHYDYETYRYSPNDLKKVFKQKGWEKIVAFQTRNPIHKAHFQMTLQSMKKIKAHLVLNPVVGLTKPGDIDYHTRIRCYKKIISKYPHGKAILALLPLAMRMGGPREAILHGIIRKNYGFTHLIIGRDHAGPGLDQSGNSFYGPYEAQELYSKYQNEIGIKMIPFNFMVYVPNKKEYQPIDSVKNKLKYKSISGTELRSLLDQGKKIPQWFTFKEISEELKKNKPPLQKRGFTVFFTGLSGSGKSTLAKGLQIKLLEEGDRPVTLLDGDVVRTHLSSELGFSKKHRSINVKRIGYVASEITKNGGVAICAPIAPYASDRRQNREVISSFGPFIEVYISTPLKKCEERDPKGLYKLARKGLIDKFTGISDPYEEPKNAELIINSSNESPKVLVQKIYDYIKNIGLIF